LLDDEHYPRASKPLRCDSRLGLDRVRGANITTSIANHHSLG
jgi:hypothetical protein